MVDYFEPHLLRAEVLVFKATNNRREIGIEFEFIFHQLFFRVDVEQWGIRPNLGHEAVVLDLEPFEERRGDAEAVVDKVRILVVPSVHHGRLEEDV